MSNVMLDLRYLLRTLLREPSFAVVAILTVALGIGASTAIFAVVDAVLIRPLPYPDSSRLLYVATRFPGGLEFLASPEYQDWSARNHVFEWMAAYPHNPRSSYLTLGDESVKITLSRVTGNFFETLGVRPILGRGFVKDELQPGGPNAVVLSDGLWRRVLGVGSRPERLPRADGPPHIATIDGQVYNIVGVMPPGFQFPEAGPMDALVPLNVATQPDRRSMATWTAIGRMKSGVALPQVEAEMRVLFDRAKQADPKMYKNDIQVVVLPLQEHRTRPVRAIVLILAAAVACLMLIACANMASLLLSRAATRQSEMAIRAALGASGRRILRQLLTESAALGLAGGLAGAAIAAGALNALRRFGPPNIPGIEHLSLDLRVLAFAVLLSLITGVVFGLAPAIRSSLRPAELHSARTLRNVFLTGEMALSTLLLISAGLLIASLWKLQNQNMGFQAERVLGATVSLRGVPAGRRMTMPVELLPELHRIPGMVSAAVSDGLPPGGGNRSVTFARRDRPLPEPWHRGDTVLVRRVTAEYFATLGIALQKGRIFTELDRAETGGVAIVNETLARRYFAEEDPIGKQIDGLPPFHWKTIVGVVRDAKNRGLDQTPGPEVYTPMEITGGDTDLSLSVRTAGDPVDRAADVRSAVRDVSSDLPLLIRPLEQSLTELEAGPRFNATLFTTFALIAWVLAIVGTFGVLSYSVAQRSREMAVRMAVGARPMDVIRLVAGEALGLAVVGAGLGVAGALGVTRYLGPLLYEVKPRDPGLMVGAWLVLILTAGAAAYVPARRAGRIDPLEVLRSL